MTHTSSDGQWVVFTNRLRVIEGRDGQEGRAISILSVVAGKSGVANGFLATPINFSVVNKVARELDRSHKVDPSRRCDIQWASRHDTVSLDNQRAAILRLIPGSNNKVWILSVTYAFSFKTNLSVVKVMFPTTIAPYDKNSPWFEPFVPKATSTRGVKSMLLMTLPPERSETLVKLTSRTAPKSKLRTPLFWMIIGTPKANVSRIENVASKKVKLGQSKKTEKGQLIRTIIDSRGIG